MVLALKRGKKERKGLSKKKDSLLFQKKGGSNDWKEQKSQPPERVQGTAMVLGKEKGVIKVHAKRT